MTTTIRCQPRSGARCFTICASPLVVDGFGIWQITSIPSWRGRHIRRITASVRRYGSENTTACADSCLARRIPNSSRPSCSPPRTIAASAWLTVSSGVRVNTSAPTPPTTAMEPRQGSSPSRSRGSKRIVPTRHCGTEHHEGSDRQVSRHRAVAKVVPICFIAATTISSDPISHGEERHRGRCAAGRGGRDPYGMPKVLADDGRWLRACVTALADGGCDDVVVVLGAAVVDVPAPARSVVAQDWERGSARRCERVSRPSMPRMSSCMRWTRPTSAPTRCDECSMRRARRRRGLPAPATGTGPDIPSSSRADTGRICSRGFVAMRARGHSLAAARMWSPSTAPTWHRVETSTSADRQAQNGYREAAHRHRGNRRCVGVAVPGAGVQDGRHRVECHLREQLTGIGSQTAQV